MKLMKEHEVFLFKPYMVNIIRKIREIWEICGSNITYLKKQTQFFRVLSPKTAIYRNQSQFKPNSNPILYLFMQNEPKLPRFQPKNHDFPKKRTQNEPKQSQLDICQKWTYTLYWQSVIKISDYLTEMKTNPILGKVPLLLQAVFGKLTQVRDVEKIADKPGLMPIIAV